jgi:superfamily II DNA or RNA helicase
MIELRDYQQKIIDQCYLFLKQGLKRLMIFSCTRSGKTIVFTFIASNAIKKGNNVLIVTNRKKLLNQTGNVFKDFGLNPFFITAKSKKINEDSKCYVAMSQTLINRLKKEEYRIWISKKKPIVIIDEAHLCDVTKVIHDVLFNDLIVLGFSGSVIRSGKQRSFSDDGFQQIVQGPYTADLEPKHCVPARVFEVPIDLEGVSLKNDGDFNNNQLFERFDKPTKYKGAFLNWNKHAKDLITIGYCVSILHAVKTCLEFEKNGVKSMFISSGKNKPKLPLNPNKGQLTKYKIEKEEYEFIKNNSHLTGETNDIIKRWEKGEFKVLLNVDILTFGYDNPSIQCVIINFATKSIPKWLQAVNRGGTPKKGKNNFIVLDLGGNSERLKDYNYKHEWSLFHSTGNGGGVPASKECPKCHALVLASSRICKYCGFEFPKSEQEQLVELVERNYAHLNAKEVDTTQMTFKELDEYARQRKYKKQWVWRQIYYQDNGEEKLKQYAKLNGYHWSWVKRQIDIFGSK